MDSLWYFSKLKSRAAVFQTNQTGVSRAGTKDGGNFAFHIEESC